MDHKRESDLSDNSESVGSLEPENKQSESNKKYHDIGITTGEKFKDKMNLKKKKPDLKNDFKRKAQRKMNL